ncbi:sugar nucleotide-binding protein [Treponema sp. OMZ 792]|uniref:sugar nucleotide-binding protein n=2 Tax=Treponema TaxID=157 RepID=UPI0020A54013|nr:sugar nucleotide-binding protein [Treponema sp. OMZ 792]UTC76294.1 sugar nucleotide-binding protein [Treponema sp. OMZ 792]
MKKISVLVLGSTGMLGNAVTRYLSKNSLLNIIPTHRNDQYKLSCNSIKYDLLHDSLNILPRNIDYVINCIGVIKPFVFQNIETTIKINSLFPWELSRWANLNSCKIIHITTDCVYSGQKGKYVETDPHDALDIYGKSKSLGEICSEAMVLRTSIIGEEIHSYASLISWTKSQKGKSVDGYKTHHWNGLTTLEYAKCCEK